MNEAVDSGYTNNLQFKNRKFNSYWQEADTTYLSESEISKRDHLNVSGNNCTEQVWDLSVFGSSVGLRFSDYSDNKPENIFEIEGGKFIMIKIEESGMPACGFN